MITFLWIAIAIVAYTFLGYGLLLYILVRIKRLVNPVVSTSFVQDDLPSLTLVVAAYNEVDIILEKVKNTMALEYPVDKLRIIFMTDGSTDGTPERIDQFQGIEVLHQPERRGKIHAIHRAMEVIQSEVVVFTDANTFLNPQALIRIASHYADAAVGAVSGEKRVSAADQADATAGEGLYWKYESMLKKWDSELYSVVGAAGELFSVRRSLYVPVAADTILDDFMISMLIAQKGYRIVYEPQAYAVELGSENIKEELKRKVRIAAGGIQSIIRLSSLLIPLKMPLLSFQYISHRVLRWTVTPFLLVIIFILNLVIINQEQSPVFYDYLMGAQCAFYSLALLGWYFERQKIRIKALFVPYYFCMMNWAVLAGIVRYAKGRQSAVWEKSTRRSSN
ncbi:glycosyltransferase family 2 protein [Dyadobacter tibetensis]|uniref:glycosyltransferase family 2 protein n=1 Tax=Dyadobacter tibetensis TaxID=1211851 RepID=UPI000471832D|nr:glycosyltransferase family 2 protein [Dyadobacter tibetensis]